MEVQGTEPLTEEHERAKHLYKIIKNQRDEAQKNFQYQVDLVSGEDGYLLYDHPAVMVAKRELEILTAIAKKIKFTFGLR